MSQLKIRGEFNALGSADIAICDEDLPGDIDVISGLTCYIAISYWAHHICDRPTWEDDSTDELADEIKATMLVRNCHDDTDRDE